MNIQNFVVGFVLIAFFACNEKIDNGQIASSLPEGKKFLDPANMDTTINPADDFYSYANGGWLKSTTIPASETRWGSFNLLEDFNKKALKGILENASSKTNSKKGSPEQMVGDLFASGMDTAAIDKAGFSSIQMELDKIAAVKDVSTLLDEIARENNVGLNPLFNLYVGPDDKNVTKNIINLFQGGLGLPDKDYYLKNEPRETDIRAKYLAYISKLLTLSGDSAAIADKKAKSIMALETSLAKASLDRVSMRDPYKMYNKFSVASFTAKTPGVDWNILLPKMLLPTKDSVLVGTPNFFIAFSGLLKTTSIEDWKTYLRWHMLNNMAPYMAKEFDSENFNFYGKVMRGQQEQKPRWKRVLSVVDNAVGEQLGKMYTDKYFTADAKKRMMELVNNLEEAYENRINALDWMSDTTKTKAKEKLHSFIKKIGYPDKWRDYTGLEVSRDSYVKNILASNKFDYQYMISKLGKEVDKTEWGMTPPTVNAYYNPAFNEIVFPAGILQYPFFEKSADDAVIYGAIGGVIGHEMTHGFDDQGCQYAADGNLKNWWSADDKKRFDAKTKMVKEQYDGYTILEDKHVNGALTLGENIADLGGVTIAFEAFKKQNKDRAMRR